MAAVKPYDGAQLEAMTTRQLLGHLSRLRKCEASLAASDLADQPPLADYDPASFIYFKDDPRWQRQHDDVKRILAGREHLTRSTERRGATLHRKKIGAPRTRE